jgi:hypothetical protein
VFPNEQELNDMPNPSLANSLTRPLPIPPHPNLLAFERAIRNLEAPLRDNFDTKRSRMAAVIIMGRLQYVITESRPGMVRRTDLSFSIVMEDVG